MSRKNELLMNVFLACPYPLSKWVYNAGRATVLKNGREGVFEDVFRIYKERGIPGDYLEFGVYRGTSFITAFNQAQKFDCPDMRFFAFDGFQGLPEGEGKTYREGQFAFPEDLFRKTIRKAGVDPQRTEIVKGFFDQSLTEEVKQETNLKQAAIVHVDCDIYSSTRDVLNFVESLVDVGTILMFDDWYNFGGKPEDHGEAKAFFEWRLKDCFEDLYDRKAPRARKKGFIMTRRPDELSASSAE